MVHLNIRYTLNILGLYYIDILLGYSGKCVLLWRILILAHVCLIYVYNIFYYLTTTHFIKLYNNT